MSIDWFTFAAQIVNFLVLVALLHHFLYGPIVKAMEDREDKIASRLDEADEKQRQADEEAEEYRQLRRDIDERRDSLLAEARQEAETTRKQLLDEARQSVDAQRSKWMDSISRQRDSLISDIKRRTTEQLLSACRQTLRELANVELEQQLTDEFVARLENLGEQPREELTEALGQAEGPPVIRTAFDLEEASAARLRDALREQLSLNGELKFKTSRELVCGIELYAGGRKLGWNVDDFLSSLADDIDEIVSEQAGSHDDDN